MVQIKRIQGSREDGRYEDSSFTATFMDMELTERKWLAHDGQQSDEEWGER